MCAEGVHNNQFNFTLPEDAICLPHQSLVISEKLDSFVEAFNSGNKSLDSSGLCARILRGVTEECFTTLSSDPGRKVVFLTDACEILKLSGQSIEQILMRIGYSQADIQAKLVEQQNTFKVLVVHPDDSLRIATWDVVFEVAKNLYPHFEDKLLAHKDIIKKFPFSKIEQLAGYSFSEVQNNGESDPRFMSEERFDNCSGTVVDVRAFLYHCFQLRELFSGDGVTRTPCGGVGVVEYIIENKPVCSLNHYRLIDL